MKYEINELAEALFSVNKHAKTALDPKFLYQLKKAALEKLLQEGKAVKIGLNFSRNPRNTQQQSDVLVQIGDYYFHTAGTKEDYKTLPHLGDVREDYRNPPSRLGLNRAKSILMDYTHFCEKETRPPKPKYQPPVFTKLGDGTRTFPTKRR